MLAAGDCPSIRATSLHLHVCALLAFRGDFGPVTCNLKKQVPERNWRLKPLAARKPLANAGSLDAAPFLRGMMPAVQADAAFHLVPLERRQWERNAAGVEPRRFLRPVPIKALIDAACPATFKIGVDPATSTRWLFQAKRIPSRRRCGMFKHPPPFPHSKKCRCEAAAVITFHPTDTRARAAVPVPSPSFAWRMRNDAVGTVVEPRVAPLIPNVDAGKPSVRSVWKYK